MNVLIAADAAKRRFTMNIFTIENETNNITIHLTMQEAEAVANAERFRNEGGLAKLAADWPAARLVEIWNSLRGESPVKKFKDRATAVSRIWKAVQSLGEAVPAELSGPEAEPAGEVAPSAEERNPAPEVTPAAEPPETAPVPDQEASETAPPEAEVATPVAPQTPDVAPSAAPAGNKATRAKKTTVAASTKVPGAPREGSKTSQVIAMLKREGGTTLDEIMTATGWQKHTVRGFIAILGKKGTKIESFKSEAGARTYKAA
jgi:hypothetical protein